MRTGIAGSNRYRCGQPEATATSTQAAYVASIAALMGTGLSRDAADQALSTVSPVRRPWSASLNASAAALYPALGGRSATYVRNARSIPTYDLRLDGVGPLPYWLSANWTQRINEPDELTISYPSDQANALSLKRPNTITLYDSDGYPLQRFDLLGALPSLKRDGARTTVEASARSLIGRLDECLVTAYTLSNGAALAANVEASAATITVGTGQGAALSGTILIDGEQMTVTARDGDTLTVTRGVNDTVADSHSSGARVLLGQSISAHVRALLSQFVPASSGVFVDRLDDALSATVFVEFFGISVLEAIRQLFTLSGSFGQFTVTASGRFVWVAQLGGTSKVDLGVNLRSLERRVDDSQLCTRLYVYGAGASPLTRVRLSDLSGVSVDYLDANTATYGVIPRAVTLDNVYDPHTLTTVGQAMLDVLSEPYLSYTVTAVELSALGLGSDAITIGSVMTVTDSDLGISTTETVASITRDLANPEATTIELANRSRDVATVLDSILRRVNAAENRDVAQIVKDAIATDSEDGGISGIPRVDMPSDSTPQDGDLRTGGTVGSPTLSYAKDGTFTRLANASEIPTVPEKGTSIQSVGSANAAGSSMNYAAADHVHAYSPVFLRYSG